MVYPKILYDITDPVAIYLLVNTLLSWYLFAYGVIDKKLSPQFFGLLLVEAFLWGLFMLFLWVTWSFYSLI